jgi:hypothetical protein
MPIAENAEALRALATLANDAISGGWGWAGIAYKNNSCRGTRSVLFSNDEGAIRTIHIAAIDLGFTLLPAHALLV